MSEITVPVGPQHPALKEPESFKITLEGERIKRVDLRIGYVHRGIEKACENRTFLQDIYLLEKVCGICSHAHTTAYLLAVEEILNAEVPPRATAIRIIMCELERIHSHLLWLGVAAHEIGFDTLFMYSWHDREIIQDLLEGISGNRVHYAMNTIGGVRRDISDKMVKKMLAGMKKIEERTKYYIDIASSEETFLSRTVGVGILEKDVGIKKCVVGPTVRASGIKHDARFDDPYLGYDDLNYNMITQDTKDVQGRVVVRALEVLESVSIIRQVLDDFPSGDLKQKLPTKVPEGESVSVVEAPRGEDIHYVRSKNSTKPDRVKVRAPSLANLFAVPDMLEGDTLADVPLVIAAIDPCMSCTDRYTVVDLDKGTQGVVTKQELQKRAFDKYGRVD